MSLQGSQREVLARFSMWEHRWGEGFRGSRWAVEFNTSFGRCSFAEGNPTPSFSQETQGPLVCRNVHMAESTRRRPMRYPKGAGDSLPASSDGTDGLIITDEEEQNDGRFCYEGSGQQWSVGHCLRTLKHLWSQRRSYNLYTEPEAGNVVSGISLAREPNSKRISVRINSWFLFQAHTQRTVPRRHLD